MNTKKQIFIALIFLVFIVGLSFITNADDGITVDVKVVSQCDPTAQNTGCPGAIFGDCILGIVTEYNNTHNIKHSRITRGLSSCFAGYGQCHCLSCKPEFNWIADECRYETQTCRVEDLNEGVWKYNEGACDYNEMKYTEFIFTPNWYSNRECIQTNPPDTFPQNPYYYTCCQAIESDGKRFYSRQEVEVY